MSKPTWAIVVGIILVLINGCGGILSDVKQIKTDQLMGIVDEAIMEISSEVSSDDITQEEKDFLRRWSNDSLHSEIDTVVTGETIGKIIKENTMMSDEAKNKFVLHGYMGIIISTLFLLTGLMFLFSSYSALPKLTQILLAISLLFVAYQIWDLSKVEMAHLFVLGQKFNLGIGAFVDVTLMIILAIVDKSFYSRDTSVEEYYDN